VEQSLDIASLLQLHSFICYTVFLLEKHNKITYTVILAAFAAFSDLKSLIICCKSPISFLLDLPVSLAKNINQSGIA